MDFNSKQYWQDRYSKGGDSGSGSKHHLAKFKAQTISSIIGAKGIKKIAELGCGDGMQIEIMHPYFTDRGLKEYWGFDISYLLIVKLREKFNQFSELHFNSIEQIQGKFDLTISMDVIYHLIEDDVFERYMQQLFKHSSKYVVIYSSNHQDNEGSAEWVRHRKFTNWIDKHHPEFKLIETVKNPWPYKKGMIPRHARNSSVSDFYIFEKK